jgi:formylglycine-generating enzyme required for sulfatase activity
MFEDREGVQRALGRREAAAAGESVLQVDLSEVLQFLDDETLYSGLLVTRSEGEFEFWHLTFQEYLAAMELAMDPDYWDRIKQHLDQDSWNELLLLLGGCLRRSGGLRAARSYILKILTTGQDRISKARAVALVSRILKDIEPYGGSPADGTGYQGALQETLGIFTPEGEDVPESDRIEVGEALGKAGDPRLADSKGNRIVIKSGAFWFGAQPEDPTAPAFNPEAEILWAAKPREVALPTFVIGKYPVTVQEYHQFMVAGDRGYFNRSHWDDEGWAWRQSQNILSPGSWEEQLKHPNRPVVWVSWCEADAYARWAGGRLPSEEEWEFAAKGAEARLYPWGNREPTPAHAAYGERQKAPSSVGIYPLGATPEGLCDMAGNVWEWCSSFADQIIRRAYAESLKQLSKEQREGLPLAVESNWLLLRGGSFDFLPGALRCALRLAAPPENRYDDVGFRVVWFSSGGQ